ncbi:MAG: CHRD domain-containing protein [Planctomycetota bacterium]
MKSLIQLAVVFFAFLQTLLAQVEHLGARLTGDQEVPPVATAANGFAIVTVDLSTNRVDVFAHGDGIVATAAHLHNAISGTNGPVILPLAGGPRTWTGSAVLAAGQVAAILTGATYVNLHTAANPGGEIRGQVFPEQVRRYAVSLNGAGEVPPNASTATGSMEIFLHLPSRVLMYELRVSGLTATAAHIHTGVVGANGPVLFPLVGGPTRWCGVTPRLSDASLTALTFDGLYVNVHTAAFPGGEIRGQIGLENDEFSTVLNGGQEVPPTPSLALGRACVRILPSGAVEYRVDTTGVVATAAHIHLAPTGVNGPVIVPLVGGPTTWVGVSAPLLSSNLDAMRTGQTYINVHSAAFPGGEIRGQLIGVEPYRVFGLGCPAGPSSRPEIGARGMACRGEVFTPLLAGGPAGQPAAVLFGFSREFVPGGGRLPLDLTLLGLSGCFLFHDNPGISIATATDALGCAEANLPIPVTAPVGVHMFAQWFMVAPGANPAGIGASNGMEFLLR